MDVADKVARAQATAMINAGFYILKELGIRIRIMENHGPSHEVIAEYWSQDDDTYYLEIDKGRH